MLNPYLNKAVVNGENQRRGGMGDRGDGGAAHKAFKRKQTNKTKQNR